MKAITICDTHSYSDYYTNSSALPCLAGVWHTLISLQEKKATAGAQWYNLPKTDLTPELKRDLQLLKMRSVLDPKRFYKKDSKRDAVPEFSHIGTIIEGPTEYFSARLNNRERKQTLTEQVLESEKHTQRFKSKYHEIQAAKTSGKKAHYKAMSAKRKTK